MTHGICMRWTDLRSITGKIPRPRYGHRVALLNDTIVLFGGGNDMLIKDIHMFDYTQKKWRQPDIKGKVPPAVASFGLVIYNNNILIYGGMDDNRCVTDGVFELDTINWRWSQHFPSHDVSVFPPCGRFGHSFVLTDDNKAYVFGGVTNPLLDVAKLGTEILNDFYMLDLSNSEEFRWSIPNYKGKLPSPRESHTCIFYKNDSKRQLIIYGGSNGYIKLGDIHIYDLISECWFNVTTYGGIAPTPRSMHTAVCFEGKMIIFGGWVLNFERPVNAVSRNKSHNGQKLLTNIIKEYITTNSVGCFDIENYTWLDTTVSLKDSFLPTGRAGHAAVLVGSRMFIFSGRDGYRKSRAGLQTCFNDIWALDMRSPLPPSGITLECSTSNSLAIKWQPVFNSDCYLIQLYVCFSSKNNSNITNEKELTTDTRKRNSSVLQPKPCIHSSECHNQPPPVAHISSQNSTPTKQNTTTPQLSTPTNLPALKVVNMNLQSTINSNNTTLKNTFPSNLINKSATVVSNNSLNKTCTPISQASKTNIKAIETITGSDGKLIPVVNLSKMGLSLAQLSKSVTFVTTKKGDLVAQVPYDQLRNFFKLNQHSPLQSMLPSSTNVTLSVQKSNNNSSLLPKTSNQQVVDTNYITQLNQLQKKLNIEQKCSNITGWYDVTIESECRSTIDHYYLENIDLKKYRDISYISNLSKISLIPGETYQIRIASINSCGVGKFSDPFTFSLPSKGLLGPPGNVKLIKRAPGLYIEWDHPDNKDIDTESYHTNESNSINFIVYMASKLTTNNTEKCDNSQQNYSYTQVYSGENSYCLISNETLESAYIDPSRNPPTAIFRIVAKNSNGIGPAIQVRWIQ